MKKATLSLFAAVLMATTAINAQNPTPAIRSIQAYIFFNIRSTKIQASEYDKIERVVKFLKDYPDANITITGFADAKTDNHKRNMKYSQKRADKLKKLLTGKYIIDPSRITTDAKDDTMQPFVENEKNRLAIVTGEVRILP